MTKQSAMHCSTTRQRITLWLVFRLPADTMLHRPREALSGPPLARPESRKRRARLGHLAAFLVRVWKAAFAKAQSLGWLY